MRRLFLFFTFLAVATAQIVPGIYVVELTGEPAIETAVKQGSRQAMGDRRAAIQAEQQVLRQTLGLRNARVLSSMDTLVNGLVVRVPDSEAAGLASLPGVRKVWPVFEAEMELDYAPILHKVPEAWKQIGGSGNAGLGVRIAIIDSGIDNEHLGFQDPTLVPPEGFPKVLRESDMAFTNSKVIVAKSYEDMLGIASPSARDVVGHGTALAMIAAGVRNKGPFGEITGIAPRAFLGSYKIFGGTGGGRTRTDVIVQAFNDAVADGFDVINFSVGGTPAPHPDIDLLYQTVERAAAAGVIVVKSAGNSGPDPNTVSSPGNAPSGITAGASWNGRILVPGGVKVGEAPLYAALPGNGPAPSEPLNGPMADVTGVDPTGLACTSMPAGSLAGKVALILRGECFFEVKLNNAEAAGAVAAVVYTDDRPVSRMDAQSAKLPAVMVVNSDGLRIRSQLRDTPDVNAILYFDVIGAPVDPNEVGEFSSRGPINSAGIKPDLLATGVEVSTAAQRFDPDGAVYGAQGYAIEDGTSFAAPFVAGSAAVLKAARPGLTLRDYRSLLINSTQQFVENPGGPAPVNKGGAGLLDLSAALNNTVSVFPTSVNFGPGGGTVDISREITITNLGTSVDTFALAVTPLVAGVTPSLSETSVQLEPKASKTVTLRFNQGGLDTGQYQGFVRIRGTRTEVETRLPYWYGVRSSTPAFLTLFQVPTAGTSGGTVNVLLRVSDITGTPLVEQDPVVTVVSGGGDVSRVELFEQAYPGVFRVVLRLGPFAPSNVFRFEAGEISRQITVRGTQSAN